MSPSWPYQRVAVLATTMLCASTILPITPPELLAAAKSKPINYGSPGVGTTGHIVGAYLFKELAKVEAVHVPFQGGAPVLQTYPIKEGNAIELAKTLDLLHKGSANIRIALGDSEGSHAAQRGEEDVGDAVPAKVRKAVTLYRSVAEVENVEIRLHQAALYNSIYRADDQVLVNTHVFGLAAAQAPAWHLRKLPGGELASLYLDCFERVWETATPVDGG